VPHDLLTRFPVLRSDDVRDEVCDPVGSILYDDSIADDLAKWLPAHDVTVHDHMEVMDIDTSLCRVCTRDGNDYHGDVVLVTAGVWTAQPPAVFFSSDEANPDTFTHFFSDMQLYTTGPNQPDPGIWMRRFLSTEISCKANKWQSRNLTLWHSPEFDELHASAAAELDPMRRAALCIQLNDTVVSRRVVYLLSTDLLRRRL
jgi:hypothetical protein